MRKKKGSTQFTGPDYLIAIAADRPEAETFGSMIQIHVLPSMIEGMPLASPSEWAAKRDLSPHEVAAMQVYGDAVLAALEAKDMQAVRELVSWGAGMLMRFNDFQRNRLDGDEPGHQNP
jgi:hypothetical protein